MIDRLSRRYLLCVGRSFPSVLDTKLYDTEAFVAQPLVSMQFPDSAIIGKISLNQGNGIAARPGLPRRGRFCAELLRICRMLRAFRGERSEL